MRVYCLQWYRNFLAHTRRDYKPKTVAIHIRWLLSDRCLRLILGLFANALMARQIGPQLYGLLNYSITFAALFLVLANLGLDSIVIRNIINHPENEEEIVITAFVIKLLAGLILVAVALPVAHHIRAGDHFAQMFISLTCLSLVFQCTDVFNFWLQARSQFKIIAISQATNSVIVNMLRVAVLCFHFPVLLIALLASLEISVSNTFLALFFFQKKTKGLIRKVSITWAKLLLRESWPLALSGLTILIYMRIDQIMIAEMVSDRAVGLYSAAVKLIEVWYFIPSLISSAFLPSVLEFKKNDNTAYLASLRDSLRYSIYSGLFVTITMLLVGSVITTAVYGSAYAEAMPVLNIYVLSTTLVYLQVTTGNWFVSEGLTREALMRNLIGGFLNIALNLYLIPRMGIQGAAIATAASFFVVILSPVLFMPRYRTVVVPLIVQSLSFK